MKYVANIQDSSGPVGFSQNPFGEPNYVPSVWIDPHLVALIISAFHYSPYPNSDGQIAGALPTCGGSTFLSYCTEAVSNAAWNTKNWHSVWAKTSTYHPVLPAALQPFFNRTMLYITSLAIFSDASSYVLS